MDKKQTFWLVLLITVLMFTCGVEAEDTAVFITRDGVISAAEISVNIDETQSLQFSYVLDPLDFIDEVSWNLETASGADASQYASVDETGYVEFKSVTAKDDPLLLTCTAGEVVSAPVEITVSRQTTNLSGLRTRSNPLYVRSGERIDLYRNLLPIPGEATIFSTDCVFSSLNSEFQIDKRSGILVAPRTTGSETVINVELEANPEVTTSFTVVTGEEAVATSISVPSKLQIPTDKTKSIKVTFRPQKATNTLDIPLTYVSSNSNVVSVDEYGNIKAYMVGEADITTRADFGEKSKSVTTHVTVIPNVPVQGVSVQESEVNLTTTSDGETTKQLNVTLIPENTTEREVTYTSLSPEVAIVDEYGLISAISEGRTTVTVSDERGHIKVLTVIVSNNPVVANFTTITATDPDTFRVLVKGVHPNAALGSSNQRITKLSCFAFSNSNFTDLNAQVMKSTTSPDDWVADYPVNGLGNNHYFLNASEITLHIYAQTADGKENLIGVISYNYTNHGTAPTNLTITPYAENIGFITPSVGQDTIAGTIAESRQLEGIRISTPIDNLGLSYRVHAADIGWMDAVSQGTYAGTMDQHRQIEAIQLSLTGEDALLYDIQYRSHCEGIGWTNWVSNGEISGTVGEGRQLEAVQIRIVHK